MNFSLWCDFVENSFLDDEFVKLIQEGKINGATSNPAIFKNAIFNSKSYQEKIKKLKKQEAKSIYEALAIEDISKAADRLAPNFLKGNDGFISLEIDPRLQDNTTLSLAEAKRLYTSINKANVMMKIPATKQSYEVMSALMSEGINVNATLVFSYEQSQNCFEALNEGLKKFQQKHKNARVPKGVISIFVSRFDKLLNEKIKDKNQIGILTANKAYNFIQRQNQDHIRALFASTGVKDESLPKDYYIKALCFEHSINTAPLDAIYAYEKTIIQKPLDDEAIKAKLQANLSEEELEKSSLFLLDDGLKAFCKAYEDILAAL